MAKFNNFDELIKNIKADVATIVRCVSLEIVDIIKRNIVNELYQAHRPRMYRRRGEKGGFLGSWTYNLYKNNVGNLESVIFSDPDLMSFYQYTNEDLMYFSIYENYASSPPDRRNIMARIIAEGTDYDFYVDKNSRSYMGPEDNWWTRPNMYFALSLDVLDNSSFVNNSFSNELSKKNIVFKKL